MDEENQRAMRAYAGFAQNALAHRLKLRLGDMNIGHFVTEMMLATRRVLVEETLDRGVAGQRLDQLNLRAVERPITPGVSTKQTFTPCSGRSNGSWIFVAPITSR
jgi:hypothetical protein